MTLPLKNSVFDKIKEHGSLTDSELSKVLIKDGFVIAEDRFNKLLLDLEIIKILTTKMPLDSDVKLQEIAVSTQNYTGADLASLCREAAVSAMQNNSHKISSSDFAAGLKKVRPSITKDVDQWYNNVKESISNVVPKAIDKTFYG